MPQLVLGQTASDWWTLETDKGKWVKLTLHPAAEPVPAMKYHLLPGLLERLPGNAAVDYGKVTAEKSATFGNQEWRKKHVYDRLGTPLEELRGAAFDPQEQSMREDAELPVLFQALELASRRESCDWQLPIREGKFYSLLIPEAQQTREFARLLFVRARIQIANGQYDQAIRMLKSGYALARNAGQAPTLIHGLVGTAIAGMMDQCVLEMAQQPGAPNLYWALTELPQPLIDIRPGIEAEANAIYLTWPELREVATSTCGAEYWRETLQKVWEELIHMDEGKKFAKRPETLAALTSKAYPAAKEALIAEGMAADKVEAMPAPQVVLLHMMRSYEKSRDASFKWFYVPYWQAREGLDRAAAATERRESLSSFLSNMLLPAMPKARGAFARSERSNAVLRLLEALRIYAAAHEGRLPDTLGDVTEVPVPIDPFTGKPFEYRR